MAERPCVGPSLSAGIQRMGARTSDKSPNSLPGIGLESGKVTLLPHSPQWEGFYERERQQLELAIGDFVIHIQHVGSTSISGIVAKPIIDIGIAVKNFEAAVVCVGPMETLGYEYRGQDGIPRRHYFVKGQPRTHHVHMVELASTEWVALVSFRDYLRTHPEVADKYAQLKHGLAKQFANDRDAYQRAKASFIAEVIARAKQECPNV